MSSDRFTRPPYTFKRWRNPDKIAKRELTSTTRAFIASVEQSSGMVCCRLHEVRREDKTSTVYATFKKPKTRTNYQTVAILDFTPMTGYVRVKY